VAAIAVHKEWVLRTGRELLVQTAPVDPRDIFRGDFVRLSYPFTRLRASQLAPELRERGLRRGETVYLAMQADGKAPATARSLELQRPAFPYLPGRVIEEWPYPGYHQQSAGQRSRVNRDRWPLRIDYGIGRFFVEQGRGLEIERIRGARDDYQRAMLVRLAVPERGQALIRDYRWADLAIRTELLERPVQDAAADRASAKLRLSLRNDSDQTFTLALRADGCSFDLLPVAAAPEDAEALLLDRGAFCAVRQPDMRTIAPGQVLDIDFDFNQPQWRARQKGEPVPLGRLPSPYFWRLVYREPLPPGLDGRIISRAFHAGGSVD
jgi:uncharacterized membrane-anchored protein